MLTACAALALGAFSACNDFAVGLEQCVDAGRCPSDGADAAGGSSGGGSSGGGAVGGGAVGGGGVGGGGGGVQICAEGCLATVCDGQACDDGNPCTVGERCVSGQCSSGQPKACSSPPGDCYADAGTCEAQTGNCVYAPKPASTPCADADACITGATCNGSGVCGGGTSRTCSAAADSCMQPVGRCERDGGCSFAFKDAGTGCEDGNACTKFDACNANGVCVPGLVCPNFLGCQTSACVGGACVATNKTNGTACGPLASQVCCGGTCVDISTDERHCGGCGTQCDTGLTCESVAVTSSCSSAPVATSGRCRCTSGTQCPRTQQCRNLSPYTGRCAPVAASDCAPTQSLVNVSSCPNYCSY